MPYKKINKTDSKNSYFEVTPEEDGNGNNITNKEKMLIKIASNEPKGITTGELVDFIKCNRETIRRLGNELIREKKIIKTGRFGHYHLSKDFAKMNTGLQANLFSIPALREMLKNSYYKILDEDMYENMNEMDKESYKILFGNLDKDFIKENTLFNKLLEHIDGFDDGGTRKLPLSLYQKRVEKRKVRLLNFSMKIGLLITFIMIEAIKPANEKIPYTEGEKKLQLSKDWIRNSINLFEIWKEFKEIAKDVDKMKQTTLDEIEDYKKRRTSNKQEFLLDEEFTIEKLSHLFQEMWPHTFKILQKIRENSVEEIHKFYDKTPKEFDDQQKVLNNRFKQLKKKQETRREQQYK